MAEVKEEETGETRTGESQIEYHERPIKLEFHTDNGVFKPGFTYTTYVSEIFIIQRSAKKTGFLSYE